MTKLTSLKLNLRIKFGNEVGNSGATSLEDALVNLSLLSYLNLNL